MDPQSLPSSSKGLFDSFEESKAKEIIEKANFSAKFYQILREEENIEYEPKKELNIFKPTLFIVTPLIVTLSIIFFNFGSDVQAEGHIRVGLGIVISGIFLGIARLIEDNHNRVVTASKYSHNSFLETHRVIYEKEISALSNELQELQERLEDRGVYVSLSLNDKEDGKVLLDLKLS